MGELTNEKKIEEAIYKLIEETFPLLDSEEARESFLGQLDRLAQWVKVMPRALDPEKKLSREEFEAAMAGLPLDAQLAEALAPLQGEHYMSGITAEELARLLRG